MLPLFIPPFVAWFLVHIASPPEPNLSFVRDHVAELNIIEAIFEPYTPKIPIVPGQKKAWIKIRVSNSGYGRAYNIYPRFEINDSGAKRDSLIEEIKFEREIAKIFEQMGERLGIDQKSLSIKIANKKRSISLNPREIASFEWGPDIANNPKDHYCYKNNQYFLTFKINWLDDRTKPYFAEKKFQLKCIPFNGESAHFYFEAIQVVKSRPGPDLNAYR